MGLHHAVRATFTDRRLGVCSMILLIDNYDSFTYNLVQFLGELGAELTVRRNDALTAEDAVELGPEAIVLSPGPCGPDQAGICLRLADEAARRKVPLLGVCLGHQVIGQAFGGRIVGATDILHGKTDMIYHNGNELFEGLPSPFVATRYHSLVVDPDTMPGNLTVTAWAEDGTIMGVQHDSLPVFGVQFHPESIATEHGHQILKSFLNKSRQLQ